MLLGRFGLGRWGRDRHPVDQGVLGARGDLRRDAEVQQGHADRHRSHHAQHAVDVGPGRPDHHHLAGPRHLGEGEQRADQHAQGADLLEHPGQAQQTIAADARHAEAPLEDLRGHVEQLQHLDQGDQHDEGEDRAGQEQPKDITVQGHEVAPCGSWANRLRTRCTAASSIITALVIGVSPGRLRLDRNSQEDSPVKTK